MSVKNKIKIKTFTGSGSFDIRDEMINDSKDFLDTVEVTTIAQECVNLKKVEDFTKQNLMKLSHTKSNTMIFNFSKNIDFPSEFAFSDSEILDCVEETKLLGVVINSNLKWHSNASHIVKKAMSRMWLLRRMKHLKLDIHLIFDFYVK